MTFIDTRTNKIKHTTYVGRSPHEAFFTPDGKEVRVIDSAVEANRDAVAAAGLTLELRVDDPDRRVRVDPTRMPQVLSNILHNATKFTGHGGTLTLVAEGLTHAGEIVFRVTDTGARIPADRLPTIFELFTQIRPDSSLRHGGMGIGLELARSLVELHGGTINAESAGPGTGSTFVVRIPMTAEIAGRPIQQASASAAPLSGLKVLVVDDNQDAADMLGELLSAHGSEVRVTYLAETALALIADFEADLVLLDIGLPNIDGYEACRRTRQLKGNALQIVALTGWGIGLGRSQGFALHD